MKKMRFLMMMCLVALMAIGSLIPTAVAQDEKVLNILYWQAASTLNTFLGGGTKDQDPSALILEPLAGYDQDGILFPRLAEEIPTVENGGISEDLTQITWTLKEGLVWSDGTPVTSADVVFTGNYCMNPETGCAWANQFAGVTNIEAIDERSITVTFESTTPYPYGPFVSVFSPILQAAQFEGCEGANAQSCTEQNFGPIGTGPFMVEEFRANDVVTFVRNPNYREEGKPYFDRVIWKGGGDAESAARAVLETGEADYAWNLQISPDVLTAMESAGNGQVVVGFAVNVERILVNQTNPDPALGDDRSSYMDGNNPHPFLTDPVVWKAMSMAIDRSLISEQLYGAAGQPTCNIIPAPPIYASPNNDDCLVQDLDGAIAMLDEAGIVDSDGDGVREYNGIPMSILYQTSTNAVRQDTQALVKQWWEQLGLDVELRNIDSAVFFGGDPASPDTYGKFYADVEMFTNGAPGTDPQGYLGNWRSSEISGPDNNWLGNNVPRFYSEEYDALYAQLSETSVIEDRAALAIQMNDLLVQTGAYIPLVHRGSASAHANSLAGVLINPWDNEMWNIADWTRIE